MLESSDILAAKLATGNDSTSAIDPVDLKHVLGHVQTNCGNLLRGRLSLM